MNEQVQCTYMALLLMEAERNLMCSTISCVLSLSLYIYMTQHMTQPEPFVKMQFQGLLAGNQSGDPAARNLRSSELRRMCSGLGPRGRMGYLRILT